MPTLIQAKLRRIERRFEGKYSSVSDPDVAGLLRVAREADTLQRLVWREGGTLRVLDQAQEVEEALSRL